MTAPPIPDNTAEAADRQDSVPPRDRRRVFQMLALLCGLLPFVLLETGLRVLDIGSPDDTSDPFVGFSEVRTMFDLDEPDGVYRTSRSREHFFGLQEFAAAKPANGYRVFCLGGSTVRGRPYHTNTAFPRWLELELAACDPSRNYEVVNCGGLSYASYRLRVMLAELLNYQPDLIVLATGHNEFLEDRTYSVVKGRSRFREWIEDRAFRMRMVNVARQIYVGDSQAKTADGGKTILDDKVAARLDASSGYASYHRDDEWRAGVVHHFDLSVRAIIEMCDEADVPIILVHLGSNLRDNAPFKSEHNPDLSPDDERRWRQAFESASDWDLLDPESALEDYQRAESIDDDYALLSFRIARCLDRLGRHDEALSYYLKARDTDVCPLRMVDELSTVLRRITEDTSTPVVDAARRLSREEAPSIPGFDWYTDHVHPTIRGHQQIAAAVAEFMRSNGQPEPFPVWSPQDRRAAYREHLDQLGPVYLANGRKRLAWLEDWARTNRLFEETLPIDARGHLHRGFRRFGFDETELAWQDFQQALEWDPSTADDLMDYALALFEQGRADAAERLLAGLATEPAASEHSIRVALARFALAIDRGDDRQVAELLGSHRDALREHMAAPNPWLTAVPAALSRLSTVGQSANEPHESDVGSGADPPH